MALTEAGLKPMTWEEFPPAAGEPMIDMFLKSLPPEYEGMYPTPESRIPLLRWARSMPLGGEPASVVSWIEAFDRWLASSAEVPNLLITFAPGPDTMLTPPMLDWMTST